MPKPSTDRVTLLQAACRTMGVALSGTHRRELTDGRMAFRRGKALHDMNVDIHLSGLITADTADQ